MQNKRNTLYYATFENRYLIVFKNLCKSWFCLTIDEKKKRFKEIYALEINLPSGRKTFSNEKNNKKGEEFPIT